MVANSKSRIALGVEDTAALVVERRHIATNIISGVVDVAAATPRHCRAVVDDHTIPQLLARRATDAERAACEIPGADDRAARPVEHATSGGYDAAVATINGAAGEGEGSPDYLCGAAEV